MDLQLRDECRNLLTKLRVSQKDIKEKLQSSKQLDLHSFVNGDTCESSMSKFGTDITGKVNVAKDAYTDLKPTYARSKLLSLSKTSTSEREDGFERSSVNNLKDKENHHHSILVKNSQQDHPHRSVLNNEAGGLSSDILSTTAASPSTIRKRQLINKHTAVESKLSSKELKELDDERLLNFNYSNINIDKNYGIKTLTSEDGHAVVENDGEEKNQRSLNPVPSTDSSQEFHKQLLDQGNDRRFNNLVKKATIEPKTLLNDSRDYYNLSRNRNNSRVRFSSNSREEETVADQRLLGYDWIAALMDNEQSMVNQSESFFDEICDFRKAYKDECNNKFYMESPYTLIDREPEPVVEALTEPKVRPFVVNERLFTEPLTSDLIEKNYDKDEKKSPSKEPTKENPRFVRVSIPRSTLQTPYRVKPHRRGSFDGSDSCSLMDHCLLGWENTVPTMMPPAKSLSLACDSGTQVNSQTTTLAEAERLATINNQVQWHLSRPSTRVETLPRWKKHYMDMTLNLTLPSHLQNIQNSSNTSTTNQSSVGSRGDVKRKTDRMLHATYSTMYEMERLRKQRELEKEEEL